MKTTCALLLAVAGSAAAFAPSQVSSARSLAVDAAAKEMPGVTLPVNFFDPLKLSELGSDETLAWFRAGELKNGRVAMLACTGYIVNSLGLHFPGMLSHDVSFESLSTMKPFDAWAAVPALGQAQIIGTIFLAEIITEAKKPHYLKGGDFPKIVFPPIDFAAKDPAAFLGQQNRELNNGRLAMIGMMGFIAESNVPGSVPLLTGTIFG
ncbi:hypothetical protein MPSEU_000198900 [Mayamaea pseudoterrestris]|nr:hypothetical protein MPSEU_000198900 [Mayamaea pseudoterrestris]